MSSITLLIKKNDIGIFYLINRRMHCSQLNAVMKTVTQMGSTGFALGITALFLVYGFAHALNTGIFLSVNLIASQIVIQFIKRKVNRPRPFKVLEWAIPVKPPSCEYSLPSGHTGAAFSIALVLAHAIPALSLLFIILAALVGVSRVYLGCHYPTDVIIGFLISFVTFVVLHNTIII